MVMSMCFYLYRYPSAGMTLIDIISKQFPVTDAYQCASKILGTNLGVFLKSGLSDSGFAHFLSSWMVHKINISQICLWFANFSKTHLSPQPPWG